MNVSLLNRGHRAMNLTADGEELLQLRQIGLAQISPAIEHEFPSG